jgi:hypothetical protein
MALYTIANPFFEQYLPRSFRHTRQQSLPSDLIEEIAFVERCLDLGVLSAAYLYLRRGVERICKKLANEDPLTFGVAETLNLLLKTRRLDRRDYNSLTYLNDKANKVIHENRRVSREEVPHDLSRLETATLRIYSRV